MEFRDTLLQNEIHHLGSNFRLLSAEMLLIQDFIKEEFGSKFLAFCNARREQQRPSFSKSSMKNSSPRKSREIGEGYYAQSRNEDDCEELFGVEEEPCIIPDGLEGSDSEGSDQDFDPMGVVEFEMDSSNSEVESKHNPNLPVEKILDASGTEAGKKGRRKSIIHKYFEKVKAEDGKLKDKCQTCGNFVSSQAQRLKKHLLKCRGNDSSIMHILNKLQVAKYTPSSNDNRPGRKTDVVRLAFEHMKDANGYNKMKCLNCGELVSNQPSRMRNHLHRCSWESEKHPIPLRHNHELSTTAEYKSELKISARKSETGSKDRSVSQSQTSLVKPSSSSAAPLPTPQPSSSVPEDAHSAHSHSLPPQPHAPSDPLHVNPTVPPLYPNSDASHGWHPTNDREGFRMGQLPYQISPPGSSYQHH